MNKAIHTLLQIILKYLDGCIEAYESTKIIGNDYIDGELNAYKHTKEFIENLINIYK